MKETTKKTLKLLATGAVLAMVAGCITLSVYPFYNQKDLTFDPGMVGRWFKASQTNEFWQFADVDGKYYRLTTTGDQDTNVLDAHLFQLQQYTFLDLLTTNREMFQLPLHLISKVTRTNDTVTLQFLDYGWLANLLQTNTVAIRHLVVPQNPAEGNDGNMVYLTAETRELQQFLLKHAEDTNAFNSDSTVELKRASQ
jgi:hypothetical protein